MGNQVNRHTTNLTAPAAIRGRLVGNRAAITARTIARREWVAANAHHGQAAIAAALGLSRDTIRNQYHALFAAPPVARIERPARASTCRACRGTTLSAAPTRATKRRHAIAG